MLSPRAPVCDLHTPARASSPNLFILGAACTRLSPPPLPDQRVLCCDFESYQLKNKSYNVGVPDREASDPQPGYSLAEGAHHGPCPDARCILEHAWRHPVFYHPWRNQDSVREVFYDVAAAVPHLADAA